MTKIENALDACKFIQSMCFRSGKIDLVPMAYAIRNRLDDGGNLHQIAIECGSRKVGENSSTYDPGDDEPCMEAVSIVTGVFAGLYDDPTNGATRFHRHDHCPNWSKTLQASALLGSYIYYRE